MQLSPKVSVVIPAYNEAARLEWSLPTLSEWLPASAEVIVVDDGSDDGTAEVAEKCLRTLPDATVLQLHHNVGKGAAVREGVNRARGESVAYMDADMATDPRDLSALLGALAEHDVAVGSRAVVGSVVECPSRKRVIMGRVFNQVVRIASGLELHDTQCGFKAFRGPVGRLLFRLSHIDGYAFDVEILLLAHRLGLRIAEVPVKWAQVDGSHIRAGRDSVAMVADVLRASFRWGGGFQLAGLRTALDVADAASPDTSAPTFLGSGDHSLSG